VRAITLVPGFSTFQPLFPTEVLWSKCGNGARPWTAAGIRPRYTTGRACNGQEIQGGNWRKGLKTKSLPLIPTFPQASAATAVYIYCLS
jgi:hypothetical protein